MENPQEFALLLMEIADRAYLTTIAEDGYPHTRAILNLRNPSLYPDQADLFAAHRDDLLVYVSTNTSSAKVREVERNPHGGIYYCHPKRWRGVSLVGDLEIVRDASIRHALWNEGWTVYYPAGADDPDHTVLCLHPRSANGWNGRERFEFALRR